MTEPRPHLDEALPVDERVELLLAEMTLREKAFQLTSVAPWYFHEADGAASPRLAQTLEDSPGHICNFGVDDPASMADIVGRLQRAMVENSRLGIPLLVHTEALNGFLAGGHMVFPTPTGLAATWSPELVAEMADVIRQQMTRVGVRQALSPNMDIALDPRWGRVHETYGEDPYLVAAFSVAFTQGMQGPTLSEGVIATAKHFVGYGLPEGGINLSGYEGGPRRTRDLFAFPFEAAIQDAGLASVMNSYSGIDGVPAAASSAVLTGLLRDTLGFSGFVSSDYMTLDHLVNRQGAAQTPGEAGRLAIEAGLDTEFPLPFGYGDALITEVEAGRVDLAHVNASVRRVLAAKFRLGLFEHPYPCKSIDLGAAAAEGTELSRELARRSVVLLENDGVLPLDPDAGQTVAVIGPHADAVTYQFATYSYPAFREMTTFMTSGGMGNMVGVDPEMAAWNERVFSNAPVEDYVREHLGARSLVEAVADHAGRVVTAPGSSLTRDLGDDALAEAVAAAESADVVVLALGGASLWFNGERTEGEGSDSADIALPAAQVRLAEAVAATGRPLVVVLTQGRAYTLPTVVQDASAIVLTSYNGPFGPTAVGETLFGENTPNGKLPYTIPRHGGQVPIFHHQRSGSGYRNPLPPDVAELYLDMPATPLYPFGRGLSYTEFRVESLEATASFGTTGSARIACTVGNVGDRAGVAVPQLYLRLTGSGVSRPAQQMAGFARVPLEAGASARVEFTVDAAQLGYTDLAGDFVVDPGEVGIFIGFDSADEQVVGSATLTGTKRPLRADERVFRSAVAVERR
ncbi:glycoside hydrolase family 3 N-terminal domain-containing protein [Plantibacter sp. 2H11-2]|uniref:glycoside hydrolase family 3 N-terminal domain-containing protein n=1 Tax=Plantibacter sp. 2H11-2 TaxID=3414431 RepID=UPI003CF71DC4